MRGMLIRRIANIDGKKVPSKDIVVDPHGEYVCIYHCESSTFMIVEILTMLKYFEVYRVEFATTKHYSMNLALPSVLSFTCNNHNKVITSLIFSQKYQKNKQIIAVSYSHIIEATEICIQKIQILRKFTYQLAHPIIKLIFLDHHLYVTMLDYSLAKIDINQQNKTFLRKKNTIHFIDNKYYITLPSLQQQESNKNQQLVLLVKDSPDYLLYQSTDGNLVLNQTVKSNQFEEECGYQNSYDQFVDNDIKQNYPLKYIASSCLQYVIGCQSFVKSTFEKKGSTFVIRSKRTEWSKIGTLSYFPIINPFWSNQKIYNLEYESNRILKNHKKGNQYISTQFSEDKILIAYNNLQTHQLIISWLIVDMKSAKRMSSALQGRESEWQEIKYRSNEVIMMRVKKMKKNICDIVWIGFNQLLFCDEDDNIYFLQANYNRLFDIATN